MGRYTCPALGGSHVASGADQGFPTDTEIDAQEDKESAGGSAAEMHSLAEEDPRQRGAHKGDGVCNGDSCRDLGLPEGRKEEGGAAEVDEEWDGVLPVQEEVGPELPQAPASGGASCRVRAARLTSRSMRGPPLDERVGAAPDDPDQEQPLDALHLETPIYGHQSQHVARRETAFQPSSANDRAGNDRGRRKPY